MKVFLTMSSAARQQNGLLITCGNSQTKPRGPRNGSTERRGLAPGEETGEAQELVKGEYDPGERGEEARLAP